MFSTASCGNDSVVILELQSLTKHRGPSKTSEYSSIIFLQLEKYFKTKLLRFSQMALIFYMTEVISPKIG